MAAAGSLGQYRPGRRQTLVPPEPLLPGTEQARRTNVHVLGGAFDPFPDLVQEQWPLLFWNRQHAAAAPPEPDTPAGMIVIKLHQPEPEYRLVLTLDPNHDFIAVRQAELSKHGDMWYHGDKRAMRFQQLPGGSWYVSAWEQQGEFGGTPERPGDPITDPWQTQRIAIKLLEPDGFPKEIFSGERFVEIRAAAGRSSKLIGDPDTMRRKLGWMVETILMPRSIIVRLLMGVLCAGAVSAAESASSPGA